MSGPIGEVPGLGRVAVNCDHGYAGEEVPEAELANNEINRGNQNFADPEYRPGRFGQDQQCSAL